MQSLTVFFLILRYNLDQWHAWALPTNHHIQTLQRMPSYPKPLDIPLMHQTPLQKQPYPGPHVVPAPRQSITMLGRKQSIVGEHNPATAEYLEEVGAQARTYTNLLPFYHSISMPNVIELRLDNTVKEAIKNVFILDIVQKGP